MSIVFVANSSWYLNNFRRGTLSRFSNITDVISIFPSGGDVFLLDDLECKKFTVYLQASGKNPLSEIFALFSLWNSLRVNFPKVAFSFTPKTNLYTLIACWVLRIPCIPNVSGVGAASELKGSLGFIYNKLAKFFYLRAAHVYFQNRDDYQSFVERGWVLPEKSELIPGSGVDLQHFQPVARDAGPVRFLMAARLIKQKGVVEYLEAAQAVLSKGLQAEFWLAGVKDHSDRAVDSQIIEQFSQQLGIEFIGHVEDMPAALSQVDCVVLPSFYPEGIPRSLIEAAAAGKVIITTDTPGCREVVERGQNGFLIPPKSVEALADAMKCVINLSPETRVEMQAASRALAEYRFDENIVIDSYIKTAERITGESLGSPA